MVTKFMMDKVERDLRALSVPEKPTGIMTFNPAGRTMLAERIQRVKDKYKEFTTPAAEGLPSLYEGNILDLAMMDVGARKLGLDEPRTLGNMYNFLQFEGQDMSPAEELASIKGDDLLSSDFKTFQRMVDLGLVSTSETGEVFRPTLDQPANIFASAGDTAQRSTDLDLSELHKVYLSGDFSPSNLYTESLGEKVSDFRNLERGMQGLEKTIAAPGGVGAGFMGGDPNLTPQYVGAELGGQDVTHDYVNEKFLKAIPVDQDPTENKEFMALLKEFDPIRHENILYLKNQLKTEKNISARERLLFLYRDAIGPTTNLGDGRKLVAINKSPADPEDFNIFSDIAAPGSPGYVGGQFAQLGIEFVPFFGVFDDVVRQAVKATGKGLSKIFGKDADKIEFVCGSPCKLTAGGKAALAKAVKNNKITQKTADALEAEGKLLAESRKIESQAKSLPGRRPPSEAMDTEQIELIKKYRAQGLSGPEIAAKPDITYNETRIGDLFVDLDLYDNVPTKRIEFEFTGSRKNQLQDLAIANMHVDSISQFLREGEDLALLDTNVLLTNYKAQRGGGKGSVRHADGADTRQFITKSDIYMSGSIDRTTQQRIIDKRNYMLQALEQDQNFVNYAKTKFDGDTSAALDDILEKGKKYNKSKSGKVAGENYRAANIYPKIDIIEKKFGKQIAAGKFPSLEQIAKALNLKPEEYAQAGRAMFRYFDAHKGNLTMPDTYVFTANSKIADRFDDIVKTFRGPEIENFYGAELYRHYEKLASRNIFGKPSALATALTNYKKANNIPEGVVVDHVGSLRALARNNNSPYVSFVQQLPAEVNAAKQSIDMAMGQAQKTLKSLRASQKWKPKEWAAEVERVTQDYRLKVANFKRKYPTVEFFEFTVDKNAIPKGDAFKSAFKDNGYGFIVSDTMDVLGKGNAMGGTPVPRKKFQKGSQEQIQLGAVFTAPGVNPYEQFEFERGSIADKVKRSLEPVQDQIKGIYEKRLEPYFDPPLKYATLKKQELEKELSDRLNPPKPVKFKFSELPRLVTQGPLAQAVTTDPAIVGLETIEFIYNSLRRGVENDIEMKE